MATTTSTPTPDPVVLTGPPDRLRATVRVENTSDARLVVRGTTLHLDSGPVTSGTAAALVGAGAGADLQVVVPLDPTTAPGTYVAELELGGARHPAVVNVETVLALNITPSTVLAGPGRHGITLVIANRGNVGIPLAARALARTTDGGPEPGPDVALVVDEPLTLEPGASTTVHGHLDVPDTLDPARRYTATVPVGVADLTVIILPRQPSEKTP